MLVKDFLSCDSCLDLPGGRRRTGFVRIQRPEPEDHRQCAASAERRFDGWVARERRLLAISREAYSDPRFKYFKDLPQDTFEAFLSVPIISQNKVVGVINVQHRNRACIRAATWRC